MTGQELIASDDVGLTAAVALANDLGNGLAADPASTASTARAILAVDPPSLDRFTDDDVPGLVELAERLRSACDELAGGTIHAAAMIVNELLARHSAQPHLALEGNGWVLHHHPPDAEVVPMWTAITSDALARLIGSRQSDRLGRCAADDCDRIFLDTSKNRSRRFCSTTCQNRVKAAAFRARRRK